MKVASAYVIQSSERSEENAEMMSWKTIVEVAKILLDDATITQADSTAAVEAAGAIRCLTRTARICFDLDGNLIEDWNENGTRKGNRTKERYEGRGKRKIQDEEKVAAQCPRSISSSVRVGISESISVEK